MRATSTEKHPLFLASLANIKVAHKQKKGVKILR